MIVINGLIINCNEMWLKYDWMVNEIWLNCILNILINGSCNIIE